MGVSKPQQRRKAGSWRANAQEGGPGMSKIVQTQEIKGSPSFLLHVVKDIAAKYEVTALYHDDVVVHGIAWPHKRKVLGPRPRSRRRLGFLSFLLGYVVEWGNSPSEAVLRCRAWRFAIRELERQDVKLPRRTLKEAKKNLAMELHFNGQKHIDLEAARWVEPYLSNKVKTWLHAKAST